MFEYEIVYIDENGIEQHISREAVGLCEVVEMFIETFCPVQSIESVTKMTEYIPQNRESRPA